MKLATVARHLVAGSLFLGLHFGFGKQLHARHPITTKDSFSVVNGTDRNVKVRIHSRNRDTKYLTLRPGERQGYSGLLLPHVAVDGNLVQSGWLRTSVPALDKRTYTILYRNNKETSLVFRSR